jgi:hypothetical protein
MPETDKINPDQIDLDPEIQPDPKEAPVPLESDEEAESQ